MKRRSKIIFGGLLLFSVGLLAGIGVGHLLSLQCVPSGSGQYKRSLDEKWVAFANTLEDGSVLGAHRTYCEFMIQTVPPNPRTVRRVTMEDTAVPPIDWREEGNISWASNSSAVTFTCDARQTRLEVTLKIEP